MAPLENPDLDARLVLQALHAVNNMVVITDTRQPDNPIVWVSNHFCSFTGFDRDDVLGKNPRFLLGDALDQPELPALQEAIQDGSYVKVTLQNTKKDGTHFHNDLHMTPIRDRHDRVTHQVWILNDGTSKAEARKYVQERSQDLVDLAEVERAQMSMDLHDGLGQLLAGLRMIATALHDDLQENDRSHATVARTLIDLSDEAILEARSVMRGLMPVEPSPHGLEQALNRLTAQSRAAAPSSLRVCADIAPLVLEDRKQAAHLYRIAQEAVHNALHHSGASTLEIHLAQSEEFVILTVCDDGRGLPSDAATKGGMGLHSMRLRAEMIGATLTIGPGAKRGTRVRCFLPSPPVSAA